MPEKCDTCTKVYVAVVFRLSKTELYLLQRKVIVALHVAVVSRFSTRTTALYLLWGKIVSPCPRSRSSGRPFVHLCCHGHEGLSRRRPLNASNATTGAQHHPPNRANGAKKITSIIHSSVQADRTCASMYLSHRIIASINKRIRPTGFLVGIVQHHQHHQQYKSAFQVRGLLACSRRYRTRTVLRLLRHHIIHLFIFCSDRKCDYYMHNFWLVL